MSAGKFNLVYKSVCVNMSECVLYWLHTGQSIYSGLRREVLLFVKSHTDNVKKADDFHYKSYGFIPHASFNTLASLHQFRDTLRIYFNVFKSYF